MRDYTYAWLLGYGTALIVMIAGLANPEPASFINIAFFRSFESIIGIIASALMTFILFPRRASLQLEHYLSANLATAEQMINWYFRYLLGGDQQCVRAFDHHVSLVTQAIDKQDDLLRYVENEYYLSTRNSEYIQLFIHIRNIIETLISV